MLRLEGRALKRAQGVFSRRYGRWIGLLLNFLRPGETSDQAPFPAAQVLWPLPQYTPQSTALAPATYGSSQ